MADKEPGKSTRGSRSTSTTPEDYPVTSSQSAYPSGDYSYTVELVGNIQHALGKLTEAIDNLKEQSKDHDRKMEGISKEVREIVKEVHGAKVAGKALLWVVGVVGTILGLILAAYFRQLLGVSK